MDTEQVTGPSVWVHMPDSPLEVNDYSRQNSSQLTTGSSETDFTNATTHSSIRTNIRKSVSSHSMEGRDSDLRHEHEQRPGPGQQQRRLR